MLLFQFVELSYHCFIQNYMEEVLTHQSSLDRVNERAQALLQTNADAKTSHAITQLTTRYHSVISMSKVCFTFKSFKYQVLILILLCKGLLMI